MAGSGNSSNGLIRKEDDVCRFSVLILLTSRRVNEIGWIKSIYTCLGNGDLIARDGSFSKEPSSVEISLREVLLATNNLSASNFIGQVNRSPNLDPTAGYRNRLRQGLCFSPYISDGCIVHRDVKPTNILLGTNFRAKLSDFGLSKVICMGLSYVSSEVRGTFGYVDPEYQKNRHVHSSTDVYSFGIVLLQLLSGQRVINLEATRPIPLTKMANLGRGGDVTEFADPKLNGEYSVEGFRVMFRLALSCTGLKQHRPSMEKVVAVLEKARRVSEAAASLDFSLQSTGKPSFVL
ncbi:UNVERIFIED_CONTAM: putative receptor-like protein kinase [Sesamum angustifolium]|uniref:Receptor-like protein kinase n=1 Tax=Sesamum angustifolium TaxID=2727405 RepID=A0AAW2MS92_9LAMI